MRSTSWNILWEMFPHHKDQAYPQQKRPIVTQTSTHIISNNFPENKQTKKTPKYYFRLLTSCSYDFIWLGTIPPILSIQLIFLSRFSLEISSKIVFLTSETLHVNLCVSSSVFSWHSMIIFFHIEIICLASESHTRLWVS